MKLFIIRIKLQFAKEYPTKTKPMNLWPLYCTLLFTDFFDKPSQGAIWPKHHIFRDLPK